MNGEMIEYYDISGCYILRPWTMSIWEIMQVSSKLFMKSFVHILVASEVHAYYSFPLKLISLNMDDLSVTVFYHRKIFLIDVNFFPLFSHHGFCESLYSKIQISILIFY